MTSRSAAVGLGSVLLASGCSLLISTSGLHTDEAADAGVAEASADGAADANVAVDGADANADAGPLCPNGGGLASGSVWPMAGGCPTHVGRSAVVGPQVAGDRLVYTATTLAFAGPVFGADDTMYFGTEGSPNGLVALTLGGATKWAGDTGGNVSAMSAVGADGTIYSGASFGVAAMRPDGTRLFRVPAGHEADSAIAVAPNGTIYLAAQDAHLRAISPEGTEKWDFPLSETPRFSNPAIAADGTIYIGTIDGGLYAVTPEGTQKWRFATGGATGSPTVGNDGTIYVGSENGNLLAIHPTGALRWAFPAGGAVVSMPALMSDGTIVVSTRPGELVAVRPDGTKRWSYTIASSTEDCDPVIGADDTTYIGSVGAGLHAVTRDGDRLFAQILPGRAYRQPAIGPDGRLYVTVVRTADNNGSIISIGP